MKQKWIILIILSIFFVTYIVVAQTSSSSINWLSRRHADELYEPVSSEDTWTVYFNFSAYNVITWNLSDADDSIITREALTGTNYIIGDEFEEQI